MDFYKILFLKEVKIIKILYLLDQVALKILIENK